jgi:hypothetical protein
VGERDMRGREWWEGGSGGEEDGINFAGGFFSGIAAGRSEGLEAAWVWWGKGGHMGIVEGLAKFVQGAVGVIGSGGVEAGEDHNGGRWKWDSLRAWAWERGSWSAGGGWDWGWD